MCTRTKDVPGTTGRKPALCDVERIFLRIVSWSNCEHAVKLCFAVDDTSVSMSSVTSVRQSGHDVWFHSHLSTQQALRVVKNTNHRHESGSVSRKADKYTLRYRLKLTARVRTGKNADKEA